MSKLQVKLENKKCKSCKEFKRCVNFAGYPAKANDNTCPYYVPKKRKESKMLKIKDNIELSELEKFGFEFNGKEWQYATTSEVLGVQDNRYIFILVDNGFNISEDTLGILYDLIKANIVEKVEN